MATIHLQVCAGFANRVRAMISGICMAEEFGMPLVIHWFPKSPECACKFSSVLDPESLPKTVKVVPEDIFQGREVNSRDDWDWATRHWDRKSDLYMKSHAIFYKPEGWEAHLRRLRPSPYVKKLLERRTEHVPWEIAIGVHIRRTDNKKSIEGSPLDSFLKKMREDVSAFYVIATDDAEVRKKLEIEFLDRCVFPAIVLGRRTDDAMIHGVVDFFALSKCTKVWGSYWSSFSEIAALYGNLKLTVV